MKKLFLNGYNLFFSQTAKDAYLVLAANIFNAFLAFIYTIFLARTFGPSEFGIIAAILAFILLVADIGDLGLGSSLSRFLPPLYSQNEKNKAASFLKTAFVFQFKIAVIAAIFVALFSSFLSVNLLRSASYSHLFLLAAVGIFGTILTAFATYSLSAGKQFKAVVIVNSVSTVSKVLFIILLYTTGYLNILTAVILFVISSYFAYFFSLIFLPLKFLKQKEKKGNLKRLLTYSVFLGFSKIFSAVAGKLDALMLIPLSSSFDAGIYSGAFKIVSLYILFAGSFSTVIAPRLSSFYTYNEAILYLKKVIIAVLFILATMVVMYLIAPWFVIFVLGSKYVLSVAVFRALLLPMAFFTMTIPGVNFLLYTLKKPQVSTFNTFVQLLIIFIGNYVFIPKYGHFGPVITLTISYAFTCFSATSFAVYFYRKGKNDQ